MDFGKDPNGTTIQNWDDWESALAYTIAMDDTQPRGKRQSARQVYEGRYGSIHLGYGSRPQTPPFTNWQHNVVQPIVGGWLKGWGAYIGWLIGFGR